MSSYSAVADSMHKPSSTLPRTALPHRSLLILLPLVASLVAGLLWDSVGAPATFLTGAAFSALALVLLLKRGGNVPTFRAP